MVEAVATAAALGSAGLLIAARDPDSFVPPGVGYAGAALAYLGSTAAAWFSALDAHTWWLLPLAVFTAGFTAIALARPIGARAWFDAAACLASGLAMLGTVGLMGGLLGT
ncbi:MAG: hypothetical protein AAF602_13970 [Myxococcota bacterium]